MTTTTSTIDVIFWDFGGVFTPSPFLGVDDYAADLETTPTALIDLVLGYAQPDGDHPWHQLERGEIAMADAARAITENAATLGIDGFEIREFFQAIGLSADDRDDMFAGVGRLQELGIRHAIVTNNIREFEDSWKKMVPDGLFETMIDSSVVGCRKPQPQIYQIALEAMGVTPDRAMFVDDYAANVTTARSLGMTGIDVGPNPLEAMAEIEALVTRP